MKIFKTRLELSLFLSQFHLLKQSIGFVPTMGALHQGHLSLIERAKSNANIVVCSIFVNPTQFNDPKDLERYPRPIDKDIKLLEESGCDVLFLPEVSEIYVSNEPWFIELEGLDERLEGIWRPGHYQGVTQVVKILFDIVLPDSAFFGQKDYQQTLVIGKMIEKLHMNVKLIMCSTLRDESGLAMSSRNVLLSESERKNAQALYKVLVLTQEKYLHTPIPELTQECINYLRESEGIELEYFQICDSVSLEPVSSVTKGHKLVALVAAKVGRVRLIDNVILN